MRTLFSSLMVALLLIWGCTNNSNTMSDAKGDTMECSACQSGKVCRNGRCLEPDPPVTGETWTDPNTGLMWQVQNGSVTFTLSTLYNSYCDKLDLGGYNDWYRPSIAQLRTLVRGCPATETGGACQVSNDCIDLAQCRDTHCDGCERGKGPANGCYWPKGLQGQCGFYASGNEVIGITDTLWGLYFGNSSIDVAEGPGALVRCVRNAKYQ